METTIRPLTSEDLSLYKKMNTGIKEDYLLSIWNSLTTGENNFLFGLFADNQLAAVAGYTLFVDRYAMLGRLRSDRRFRGNSLGTLILKHAIQEALKHPSIQWIGANTEQHNYPTRKILEKLGLPHVITLYGALTQDLNHLIEVKEKWRKLTTYEEKLDWIRKTYLNPDFPKDIFPFETHYPFPAAPSLFSKELLDNWMFYENEDRTRYFILWSEYKGTHYLNVTYPWKDVYTQTGLWETIDPIYQKMKQQHPDCTIWIDFTPKEVEQLPDNHPFELPSPWMLYGKSRRAFLNKEVSLEETMQLAQETMNQLEKEVQELEKEIQRKKTDTENLRRRLYDLE